jgi:hypothetical protein
MKITESANQMIVYTMKKKGLDPSKVFLEIGIFNGDLGMGFTREPFGKIMKEGELNLVLSGQVDADNLTVDYGEVDGKKGLIFLGEDYVNKNN